MKIKPFIFVLLMAFIVTGCNTVEHAAKGAQHGMKKDWENFKGADGWIKENMW